MFMCFDNNRISKVYEEVKMLNELRSLIGTAPYGMEFLEYIFMFVLVVSLTVTIVGMVINVIRGS